MRLSAGAATSAPAGFGRAVEVASFATLQEADELTFSGDAERLTGDVHIAYGSGERVRIAEAAIAMVSLRTRVVEIPEPEPTRV